MNVYEQLGLDCIINASGPVTRLGGAPLDSGVQNAFLQAAKHTVPLDQLHAAASREIAKVCQTEAGLVTAGCAAAITLGTAGILAGSSLSRMEKLPHINQEFPDEIIIAREQRSGYDHAVRATGAQLIEVGFNEQTSNAGVRRTEIWEYEAAISENTAGLFYVYSRDSVPKLSSVVKLAQKYNLPVLVDAAGELPPRENISAIASTGADLVAFSGGKAIGGPQSTGILCGKQALIASAALQMLDMDDHYQLFSLPPEFAFEIPIPGIPRHGIGRSMKVSKEEIVSLLTAIKRFVSGNFLKEYEQMCQQLKRLADTFAVKSVLCKLHYSEASESPPLLEILLQGENSGNAFELCKQLRQHQPPVYIGHSLLEHDKFIINPVCIKETEYEQLSQALQTVLR